jgi:hypothetical protein
LGGLDGGVRSHMRTGLPVILAKTGLFSAKTGCYLAVIASNPCVTVVSAILLDFDIRE